MWSKFFQRGLTVNHFIVRKVFTKKRRKGMSSKNHMISRHMYFFFDEEVVMLYCDSL